MDVESRVRETDHRHQPDGDDQVHQWAGNGDGHLVPWIFRNGPQGGHATDWEQGDALDLNPKTLGHHAVAEFMQHDTGEHRTHEDQGPGGRRPTAAEVALVGNKGQQQQERYVQPQADPEHPTDWKRPAHGSRLA